MDIQKFALNLGLDITSPEVVSVCEGENSDAEKIRALVAISNEVITHAKNEIKLEWGGPDKISASVNHPKIKSLENSIKSALKDVEYYSSEANRNLIRMAQFAAELRELKRTPDIDLRCQCEALLRDYSELLEPKVDAYNSQGIYLFTKNLQIRHYQPEHNIDYKVDIGSYRIYLQYGGEIQVTRHKGNFRKDGYCHPHVSASGNVCWGSEHLAPTKWAEKFDVKSPVLAILGILQNYNPDSPYRTLSEFILEACDSETLEKALETITDVSQHEHALFWQDDFNLNYDDFEAEFECSDEDDEDDEDRCKYAIKLYQGNITLKIDGKDLEFSIERLAREKLSDGKFKYHRIDAICGEWELD